MLERLRIRNLLVVESAELEFRPGLNVLTGSTGAGKSLVMGAVNLLLGQRADADRIRAGADAAVVEACFRVPRDVAGDAAVDVAAGGVLQVRREIRRNGRGSAAIGGRAVSVRELARVCAAFIEPHAQQEGLRLRDPQAHGAVLDAAGVDPGAVARWRDALAAWQRARSRLEDFETRVLELRSRRELLEHRIAEVERIDPQPGERERLERDLAVMESAERIAAVLSSACESLYDADDAALARLAVAARDLARVGSVDARLAAMAEDLERAQVVVSESVASMRAYLDDLEFDPESAEHVRRRLDALLALERRHGMDVDAVVEAAAQWRRELDALEVADEDRREHEAAVEAARGALEAAGEHLTRLRLKVARRLDREVTRALEALGMRGARFRTELVSEPGSAEDPRLGGVPVRPDENGPQRVRFRVRTNPGQPEGPLERVASTGELSRIALALRALCATGAAGRVLVFDEIDTGVGADLGPVIAEKLLALARDHQVICITHMPHVAAAANHHLVVRKTSDATRAVARVAAVAGNARRAEIERMIGGGDGEATRALAEQLLGRAGPARRTAGLRP